MRTPFYVIFGQLVENEWENLKRKQLTPWNFIGAGGQFRISDFYGKIINFGGPIAYGGSVREVFWSGYVEPFLKDIVNRMIEESVRIADAKRQEIKPALDEMAGFLKLLTRQAYQYMADIDQRLRGAGRPNSVPKEDVSLRIEQIGRFVDDRVNAEIEFRQALPDPIQIQTMTSHLAVFVSHSSHDSDLAAELVTLIRSAMDIPYEKIRCTSVDGYKLPTGVSTDDQLRQEVRESQCFIALLTPDSIKSQYVMFELGARWGARLRLLPLMARGLTPKHLGSPLSSVNAVSAEVSGQLHQFLNDLAEGLGLSLHPPHTFDTPFNRTLAISKATAQNEELKEIRVTPSSDGALPPLSASATELLNSIQNEPDLESRGIVEILTELHPGQICYFPRIQYGGTPLMMKARTFRDAINQLLKYDWLYQPEHNSSRNTRTYEFRSKTA